MSYSVIIPAHNEEGVIGRCLKSLMQGLATEAEVLVVCNGCKDRTAEIAKSLKDTRIQVIETDRASKSHALNLGDEHASLFPRFYLDADIVTTGTDLAKVAQKLKTIDPPCLVAAPQVRFDLNDRSWAVRAFYDVWTQLPYLREAMVGSGLYGLSQAGRARFDRFPSITADDAYVRLNFRDDERSVVKGASFTVTPPDSLAGIIAIKTRSHFGNLELAQTHPDLLANEEGGASGGLMRVATKPWMLAKLAVYIYVKAVSRRRAKGRLRRKEFNTWERDESSRGVAQPSK